MDLLHWLKQNRLLVGDPVRGWNPVNRGCLAIMVDAPMGNQQHQRPGIEDRLRDLCKTECLQQYGRDGLAVIPGKEGLEKRLRTNGIKLFVSLLPCLLLLGLVTYKCTVAMRRRR